MACPAPFNWHQPHYGQWTSAVTTYAVPSPLTATEMQALLNAKCGMVVPITEPERIIYMGEKAYRLYHDFCFEQQGLFFDPRKPAMFLGIPAVCTSHLRPLSVLCADLHLQNELGDIVKEQFEKEAKDERSRQEWEQIARAVTYRLEEPNRIWAMVLLGLTISWIIGLLYAWKIGLLILGR
jgi:hypothetical protein